MLPHSWLLEMPPFHLDFHNMQAKRDFLDNFAFMYSRGCAAQRFRHKGMQSTKAFLCAVKALSTY